MEVYNNLAKTYTYDFSQALPALADGLTFGNCTYKGESNLTTNVVSGIGFHGSVLTFSTGRISSREGTMILSYTATVTSDNYKDFRLTLRVQTKDKKAVPVQEDDITMAAGPTADPDHAERRKPPGGRDADVHLHLPRRADELRCDAPDGCRATIP